VRKAKEALSVFPDSPFKRALFEIADFIVDRSF
jgi:geranylgeranyl pyrophosphate synthase